MASDVIKSIYRETHQQIKLNRDGPEAQFLPLDRMPRDVSGKQRELAQRMKFFYTPYETAKSVSKQKEDKGAEISRAPLLMLKP